MNLMHVDVYLQVFWRVIILMLMSNSSVNMIITIDRRLEDIPSL